ncbi:MAG: hypothetical protein AAGH15_15955 [Myxococcota bacterium]
MTPRPLTASASRAMLANAPTPTSGLHRRLVLAMCLEAAGVDPRLAHERRDRGFFLGAAPAAQA